MVWTHRSTRVAPKTVNQKRYVDSIRDNTITFGIGPAGTGKTYLAMAMATAALSRRDVNRIILTRPAVEAGERLGFLPGNLMEKVDPYLRPLFDALYDMLDAERVNSYLEKGVIEVAPLAFMRGRTLNDSFIILDEAQNTTPGADEDVPHAARLQLHDGRDRGHHADRPAGGPALRPGRGAGHPGRGPRHRFVHFGGEDVVRHKLVQRIVARLRRPRAGGRARPARAAQAARGLLSVRRDRVPAPSCGPRRWRRWRRAASRTGT